MVLYNLPAHTTLPLLFRGEGVSTKWYVDLTLLPEFLELKKTLVGGYK